MGARATPLMQFLHSLCHGSRWSYAMFWKLQHNHQMILTCEDGYYDHPKLRGSFEGILNDLCFNDSDEMFSSRCEASRHDGHLGENQIGKAVSDMASFRYQWGQGVVGEVAYTGNHCWLSFESISSGDFESKCPDEWLLQFAAGIETIVLVPVAPHGVLQLGASEKVAEDVALVAYVRDLFFVYQNGVDLLPFTGKECLVRASSSLMPNLIDNLDELSATTVNLMNSEEPNSNSGVKPSNNKLSAANQMALVCPVQDACQISGEDTLVILNNARENEISSRSIGLTKTSISVDESLSGADLEMMGGRMVGFSSMEEELLALSYSDNCNVGLFGELDNATLNSYSMEWRMEQLFVDMDAAEHLNTFSSFPIDCELHKALGPASLGQTREYLWDSFDAVEDASISSGQISNRHLIPDIEPPIWGSSVWSTEHLLEAVVTGMQSSANDDLSNESKDPKLSIRSLGQFAASKKAQSQSEEGASVEKIVPCSSWSTVFGARSQNATTESPPASSLESMMSTLIDEQQQEKMSVNLQSRNGSKLSNACKRRARPGENPKPRPRDRQLIQDRVKELRVLVPNGSKCSIDGLLDGAIKHMLFLRSVTDQAGKLKQLVHQEVGDRKNIKSWGTKCDSQRGTSWAFELGSDRQVCPIVVEDLEYLPGHMLIEMLCDDHRLFLEIAEVIRRRELTILKGVMESRANRTWAHFIVEVSKGFHRHDIFWPLMQLLQQNEPPISSKI